MDVLEPYPQHFQLALPRPLKTRTPDPSRRPANIHVKCYLLQMQHFVQAALLTRRNIFEMRHCGGFPAKRQERFVYTRSWRLKWRPKVLWAPCPIKTGVTLSVLIWQHVSVSLVPLSSINWMTKHGNLQSYIVKIYKKVKVKSESEFSWLLIWLHLHLKT